MSDIDSDKWLEDMKSKMDSMGSNQVWTLGDPPKGARPVGCKWVYKRKLGADGEVTAFKARLVAKDILNGPGVDFEETYSPVAMAKSIRILLAIAAWYDYEIWQMDMKTAFLNGFVEEEIFMDQPEGFTAVGEGTESLSSPKISGSSVACLVLYVDDILFIGNDVNILRDIKAWLSTQFKLNGGVVAWKSSKQDTTVDSTTEAEYIAASEAAKEAIWMKNYIQELDVVPSIA
ncbi:UNVERIFIED_CONTAM: Retrovirus-related Pol polyprotein from transposon TNT 1-94 [Sesamum latifolium]|uniref:Retrovirus-related Pol polyprotein from transposon TNT 1-94 n=1 Tax=Sesamum latifolium TaxID=2727402 RepID=A0AAW2WV72_9LAMI